MAGNRLPADVKESIRACLRRAPKKPDYQAIATAFSTTAKIVRVIYMKIKQVELLGTTTRTKTLGRPPIITIEMEEAVTYLIATIPYIYQDEVAEFIYDSYNIQVSQSIVSRLL